MVERGGCREALLRVGLEQLVQQVFALVREVLPAAGVEEDGRLDCELLDVLLVFDVDVHYTAFPADLELREFACLKETLLVISTERTAAARTLNTCDCLS